MKPIIFSSPMVQAILEGRKTQTRRVVKPANPFKAGRMGGYSQGNGLWIDGYKPDDEPNGHIKDYSVSSCWWEKKSYIKRYAPYKLGDILWVRETWFKNYDHEYGKYFYRADGETIKIPLITGGTADFGRADGLKWRSPYHMPKEATRIFLRVTDVRVERLQEMEQLDFLKEGIRTEACKECIHNMTACEHCDAVFKLFRGLWDNLNAKRGYGWDVNPWVWVIEFERIEKPEGAGI